MAHTADAQWERAGSSKFAEPSNIPPVGQILLSGFLLCGPWNELCCCLCDCCWIGARERRTGCNQRRGCLEIFS